MAAVKQAMEEELDADAELLGLKRKKKPAAAGAADGEAAAADGAAGASSSGAAAGDGAVAGEASTSGTAAGDDELVRAGAGGGRWCGMRVCILVHVSLDSIAATVPDAGGCGHTADASCVIASG